MANRSLGPLQKGGPSLGPLQIAPAVGGGVHVSPLRSFRHMLVRLLTLFLPLTFLLYVLSDTY